LRAIDEDDLSFCGPESTEKHLTLHANAIKYDSECNICPDNGDCVTSRYYSPGKDLIVTCWTDLGEAVLGETYVQLTKFLLQRSRTFPIAGRLTKFLMREHIYLHESRNQTDKRCSNSTWLKTADHCYVSETGLAYPANRFTLANCGAIGFLQANYTGDYDSGTTARIGKASKVTQRSADSEPVDIPLPEPIEETGIGANYLINLTVGNDHVDCRSCANVTCDIQEIYHFQSYGFSAML
jgi:hypothetical protein